MFGTTNLFAFFSGFTFRNLSRYSIQNNYIAPSNTETPAAATDGKVETQPTVAAETAPAPETVEKPQDTIELSNPMPDAPVSDVPTTYSPETVAENASDAETPEIDPVPEEQPEQVPEESPAEPTLVASRMNAKFKLNMAFNLSQFEQTVSAFAKDAEDGQVNIADYTDLNIGLHTNLKMKVSQKDIYKLDEGMEGVPSELHYREKGRLSGLSAAMLKSRGFEAAAFYRESMRASYKMNQSFEDGFLRVSRKLAMRYTQDIHLNLRSMNLYNSQAQAMDQSGNLDSYLNNTEALVDSPQTSGDLLNQFFDTVQGYLDGAEEQLIDKVDNFFDTMENEMGLDSGMLDSARETMVSSIESFFDKIDSAVGGVTAKYMPAPEAQPEIADQTVPPEEQQLPEIDQEVQATAAA